MENHPYINGDLRDAIMDQQSTVVAYRFINDLWHVLCRNSKDQQLINGMPYSQYVGNDEHPFKLKHYRGGSQPTAIKFFQNEMNLLAKGLDLGL